MVEISSISLNELAQRRRKLRGQRRVKNFQLMWQVVTMSGLTAGAIWLLTLPGWVITTPEQVEIRGNRFLATKTILALLPLTYPESLLKVQPHRIVTELEARAPIQSVQVARQLIPPKLMIQVRERVPVAITVPIQSSASRSNTLQAGLLDDNGKWMPIESYGKSDQSFPLPNLKVIGMPESLTTYWPEIYRLIQQSSVKVFEIDWRDTSNLVMKTSTGTFYLGPYSNKFPEQLNAINRMKKLGHQLDASRIAYIDLKNPQAPIVQVIQSENSVKNSQR